MMYRQGRPRAVAISGWLVALGLLNWACAMRPGSDHKPESAGFPRTLNLPDGGAVTIPTRPEKIVSLAPSNDDILCALVDEHRITALSRYSQDPDTSNVSDVSTRIGVRAGHDPEQIIALHPDLVLAVSHTDIELRTLLFQSGIPVVTLTQFHSFGDIESNIRLIARAVGEESKAETIVAEMDRRLETAKPRLRPQASGMRVLYLAPGIFTAGSGTAIHEILRAAGVRDAAAEAGIAGNVKIDPEQITRIAPDCILIGYGYQQSAGFRESLQNNPQLASVSAIKQGKIVELPARNVFAVSQHVADSVELLVESVNRLTSTREGDQAK
jgi:iron complex transport system substrate-binding protein